MIDVENKNFGPLEALNDMEKKVSLTSSNSLARYSNIQIERNKPNKPKKRKEFRRFTTEY
jgi:hypothetical protein